jgi:hypothetical protein
MIERESLLDCLMEGFAREHFAWSGETFLGDGKTYPDAEQAHSALGSLCWSTLDETDLEPWADALFFFSPAAMVHFLPAYLYWAVKHLDSTDLFDVLLTRALTPTEPRDAFFSWQSVLKPSQNRLVAMTLQFFSEQTEPDDDHPAKQSLAGFWGRYLT